MLNERRKWEKGEAGCPAFFFCPHSGRGVDWKRNHENLYLQKQNSLAKGSVMSQVISLEITSEDFRQNYVPEPVVPVNGRHWMLDFAPARDLLKATLLKRTPSADAHLFRERGANIPALDVRLDEMIDVLGMRGEPRPVGHVDSFTASVKLLVRMFREAVSLR